MSAHTSRKLDRLLEPDLGAPGSRLICRGGIGVLLSRATKAELGARASDTLPSVRDQTIGAASHAPCVQSAVARAVRHETSPGRVVLERPGRSVSLSHCLAAMSWR